MTQRNKILLFSPFNDIIHRHEALLNLSHHSLLSLERKFFIGLMLIGEMHKFSLDVATDVVFVLSPLLLLIIKLLFKVRLESLTVEIVVLLLLLSYLFGPCSLFIRLREDGEILISVLLQFLVELCFEAVV